jgi:hypothetical protein
MTPLSEVELQSRSYELEEDGAPPSPPSQRLLTAILLRAVRDFVTYRRAKEGTEQYAIMEDAAGWIFWDGEDGDDPQESMTFLDICEQIDVDPRRVRKIILRLKPNDLLRLLPPVEE